MCSSNFLWNQSLASLEHLMAFMETQGFATGPAILDLRGWILSPLSLNDSLLEILEELFDFHQELDAEEEDPSLQDSPMHV
jgi:hypothetical protein